MSTVFDANQDAEESASDVKYWDVDGNELSVGDMICISGPENGGEFEIQWLEMNNSYLTFCTVQKLELGTASLYPDRIIQGKSLGIVTYRTPGGGILGIWTQSVRKVTTLKAGFRDDRKNEGCS